jgi:CBS domain-containing protein
MASQGVQNLPVVDAGGRVVGLVTQGDLRRGIGDPRRLRECRESSEDMSTSRVADFMSKGPTTLLADQPLTAGIDDLLHEEGGGLPVVDAAGKLVAIVSHLDAIQSLR